MENIFKKAIYLIISFLSFQIVLYISFKGPKIFGWTNFLVIYGVLFLIIMYLHLRNKKSKSDEHDKTPTPGDHHCPECSEKTLHVESDNSAYCDNCDYVTEEWGR